ncbi:MAG: DegT/DnrJ/EryC1/StrS aminotransferase family protein [Planctomycetes bacterium]|nr:DegT/DnrJ/EryC1/StrS aminotransferase family protein [Planctomycetota bacterium]
MTDAIPLSLPDITDAEIRNVVATLRSGRLSMGPQLEEFERLVSERIGRRHGIGVSSGTSGLYLGLTALGVGPGNEVITPAFSFVASANCVLATGATPIFVDCDPGSLNMRPREVQKRITDKTKAIIGVEVFGNPSGMAALAALAAKYEIPLVEDACEGLGGRSGSDPIGRFGRVSIFGFYPNKQITTGEGGMILTDDDHLADLCRSLRNQGRASSSTDSGQELGCWLVHERLGFNYRLSEINAALGVAQMHRLDSLIEARERIAALYTRRLMGNTDLILPTVEPETFMSWFVYVVRLSDRFTAQDRQFIINGLRRHDVGASNYFPPIPLLPFYRQRFDHAPGDFPIAESVSQRTIALPFFTRLTQREVDLVCQTLELMMTRITFSRS